jgi:hypothetical protein
MERAIVLGLGWALMVGAANAYPPPGADMSLAPWFQGLRQPGTGMSCCSISDCRQTDFRTNGSHYEAMIEGRWLPIPPDKILDRTDNPTGRAVVCYTPTLGIMCFIRGPET